MVDLVSFKKKLRNDVFRIYRTSGYKSAIQSIYYLIKTSNLQSNAVGDKTLPIQIRGECCELLIELGILEYAKVRKLPWFVYKGLVLERRDHKKGTTELDLTLFTPSNIILFESKYRKGKIKLIDKCTIVPDYGNVTDVYKQNLMHLDNLRHYVSPASVTLKLGKPFCICLFVESQTRIEDCREDKYKELVKVISLENLESYLVSIESDKNVRWDVNKLHDILVDLDKLTDDNLRKHMEGVAKKHGN